MGDRATTSDTAELLPVLEQLLAGDSGALRVADQDATAVDALVHLSSSPELGARLRRMARPDLAADAHPGALLLYVASRVFSDEPDRGHFDADLLEALDGSLRIGATAWAAATASLWQLAVLTRGEVSLAWERTRPVRDRYRDSLDARTLSAFAIVAEKAADRDEAAELWRRARTHDDVVRSARVRWIVDFDWAHAHLMGAEGQYGRASTVLSQVCSGLVAMRDPMAEIIYLNAAVQRLFCDIVAGRPRQAIEHAQPALARAHESFAEFAVWLDGGVALAQALLGEPGEARAAVRIADATTDTCTLELSGTIPAELLAAAQLGDALGLRDAVARARAWEQSRDIEHELRILWRTFALWALERLPDAQLGQQLARELEALLEPAVPMAGTLAHARLVLAVQRRDRAATSRAREDLEARGVTFASGARDPWGLVVDDPARGAVRTVGAPSVRVEVLDRTGVEIDGVPIDAAEWDGRRKARVALALLVAAGGTVHRDELVDALWSGELLDPAQRQTRLSTVLAQVRKTIMAQPRATSDASSRSLVLGSAYVELRLAPDDSTDVEDVQALVHRVAACGVGDRAQVEELAEELGGFLRGHPLSDVHGGILLESLRSSLEQVLGAACVGVVAGWLAAVQEVEGACVAPTAVEAASEHALRIRPYDETAVAHRMELLARGGRRAEASIAFHDARARIADDLGATPTVELVRLHARLLQDDVDVVHAR